MRVDDRHVGALAIEIFVDEIGVAVVALDGSIVSSIRLRSTARAGRRRRDGERRRRTRAPAHVTAVQPAATVRRRIIGVGVSVPGLIRESDNVVVAAPNLGWTDTALASLLDDALELGLPELRRQRRRSGRAWPSPDSVPGSVSDHMLFVTGEVGVGGGFVAAGAR